MSGFIFDGPLSPYFELFQSNFSIFSPLTYKYPKSVKRNKAMYSP